MAAYQHVTDVVNPTKPEDGEEETSTDTAHTNLLAEDDRVDDEPHVVDTLDKLGGESGSVWRDREPRRADTQDAPTRHEQHLMPRTRGCPWACTRLEGRQSSIKSTCVFLLPPLSLSSCLVTPL